MHHNVCKWLEYTHILLDGAAIEVLSSAIILLSYLLLLQEFSSYIGLMFLWPFISGHLLAEGDAFLVAVDVACFVKENLPVNLLGRGISENNNKKENTT